MRVMETKVYQFAELDDRAKERARDWWRRSVDSNDFDHVIEDAATIADILGINLRQQPVKLMNGATRYDPCIYWSLSYSQGDGACFEGTYRYAKNAARKIRDHAPQDTELHAIADQLQALQRRNFYRLEARCSSRRDYMVVDVTRTDDVTVWSDSEEQLTQILRNFADWIYSQLRKEDDYINSDEQVDEAITANEYEFTEDGDRA